jgi:hypothetical protein
VDGVEPLPATAEALDLLAAAGDEDLGTRLGWLSEVAVEVVPQAHAVAIWFIDEDVTLALAELSDHRSHRVAHPGMRSSLALELATPTRVIALVTIYSRLVDVFAGRTAAVERALGAVRGASVVNHDLAFGARRHAEVAPARLRARSVIDTAVGLLVGTRGFSIDEAEEWLEQVSRSDGRTALEVATQVLDAHSVPREDQAP